MAITPTSVRPAADPQTLPPASDKARRKSPAPAILKYEAGKNAKGLKFYFAADKKWKEIPKTGLHKGHTYRILVAQESSGKQDEVTRFSYKWGASKTVNAVRNSEEFTMTFKPVGKDSVVSGSSSKPALSPEPKEMAEQREYSKELTVQSMRGPIKVQNMDLRG